MMKDVYTAPRPTRRRALVAMAGVALALTACSSGTHAQAPKPRPSASSTRLAPSPSAAPTTNKHGFDVSYPQCNTTLPEKAAFGIVGLNKFIGTDFNPCFKQEMKWAKKLPGAGQMPGFSVYVHIENPGAKLAKHWPTNGGTPYGTCHGETDTACSYEYGEDLAYGDLRRLNTEGAGRGLRIFEDVEEGYSWQGTDHAADNLAAMEGMATAFEQAGDTVGIYSNAIPMDHIVGPLPPSSNLRKLPVWVLGAENMAEARQNCASNRFAGKVVIAQLAGNAYPIDEDVLCPA